MDDVTYQEFAAWMIQPKRKVPKWLTAEVVRSSKKLSGYFAQFLEEYAVIADASRACPVCGLIGGDHDQPGCEGP